MEKTTQNQGARAATAGGVPVGAVCLLRYVAHGAWVVKYDDIDGYVHVHRSDKKSK